MLDGRSFSKMIKKKFALPFDSEFIRMMDETARRLCENIQGAKFAYVQSDEISILVEDKPESESFFGNRITKILSITASIATGYFNQELWKKVGLDQKPVQFDSKVWNVSSWNDVFAWFLYRQEDCTRNSKLQVAQKYYSHKDLMNRTADEDVQRLRDEKGISWWHDFSAGEKFGRYVFKEIETFHNDKMNVDYERSVWKSHYAKDLTKTCSDNFLEYIGIK